MSKVIIFGGSGFVGMALRKLLEKEGVLYLAPSSNGLDLTDSFSIPIIDEMVEDGDVVIMLAVLTQERGDAKDTTLKNIMMARNLLAGIKEKELRHFIYVSSDSVYGKSWEMINQETPVCPDTLYGYMHAMREQYFREYFPALTIIRPCAIYGIGDTHNSYGINRFAREAKDRGEISLFGQGEEYRANIHVDDVAAIIYRSMVDKISGTFNAVSGRSWRFSEIANLIARNSSKEIAIVSKPRTTPISHRHFDNTELLRKFPRPRSIDLEVGNMLGDSGG